MSDTLTPYLKLTKPPADSIPWDSKINRNFDTIDAALGNYFKIPNFQGTWQNSTTYTVGQVLAEYNSALWQCLVAHTSAASPTTFATDRALHPTYWSSLNYPSSVPEAPTDGKMYGRQTSAWIEVPATGKNLIHNPFFEVQQRTATQWTASGYTMDRWLLTSSLDTPTIKRYAINQPSDFFQPGNNEEAAKYALEVLVSPVSTAAGAFTHMSQRIEGVRRLSNKTVTVSFYIASQFAATYGVNILQNFGTGGSPSTAVWNTAQTVSVIGSTGTYTRFARTFVIPSANGKVLGTNGDDYTQLTIWYSSGSTNNANAGNIGAVASFSRIWGVQLEINSAASSLDRVDYAEDLANCQRFFLAGNAYAQGYQVAAQSFGASSMFPVTMRTTPTIVVTNNGSTNVGTITGAAQGRNGMNANAPATATGTTTLNVTYTASADL